MDHFTCWILNGTFNLCSKRLGLSIQLNRGPYPPNIRHEVQDANNLLARVYAEASAELLHKDSARVGHTEEHDEGHVRNVDAFVEHVDSDEHWDCTGSKPVQHLRRFLLVQVRVECVSNKPLRL